MRGWRASWIVVPALNSLGSSDTVVPEACTRFARCFGFPSNDVLGPVAIEVIP